MIWTTKSKGPIEVKDMKPEHLANAIDWLKKDPSYGNLSKDGKRDKEWVRIFTQRLNKIMSNVTEVSVREKTVIFKADDGDEETTFSMPNMSNKGTIMGHICGKHVIKTYHPSGSIHTVANWDGHTLSGKAYEYYEAGNLKSEGFYDETGQYHGQYKEWDKDGNLIVSEFYDHGKKL